MAGLQRGPNKAAAPPTSLQPTAATWETLARYLAKVYDQHLAASEPRRALFEPHRVVTPDGYHSIRCVAAGLYVLLEQTRFTAKSGSNLPTEITGSTLSNQVLEHSVPIYFVGEDFARAVAATELPGDLSFADLHWPQMGMAVGWPPRFMLEYTHREVCYVYAANCPAGSYWPKGRPESPIIEVPEGRGKIGWFYHACVGGRVECFVSAYLTKDRLAQAFTDYAYTDYMGAARHKVQADQEFTERVSALMLKLLVVLNMQPSLITHGTRERLLPVKQNKLFNREVWSANFIGRGYRLARERTGTHASPRMHIRRGHITWQVIGPRSADAFISASALPSTPEGWIDWAQVTPEAREKFLRCHKRLWLQPILICGKE